MLSPIKENFLIYKFDRFGFLSLVERLVRHIFSDSVVVGDCEFFIFLLISLRSVFV